MRNEMKIEQTERIYKFIMFLSTLIAEGDIFYNKITGYKCVERLGKCSTVGYTQLIH